MKKLIFITFLVLQIKCFAANIEGFCQSFNVPTDSNVIAMTVPAGKEFVLRKLLINLENGKWEIRKNEVQWLFGMQMSVDGALRTPPTDLDFPDRIVIVGSGQVLKLMGNSFGECYYTLIGYFRDVQTVSCAEYLDSDLNKDCIVNFFDLALLANDWLDVST